MSSQSSSPSLFLVTVAFAGSRHLLHPLIHWGLLLNQPKESRKEREIEVSKNDATTTMMMMTTYSSWLWRVLCLLPVLMTVGVQGSSFLFNLNDDPNEKTMLDPSDLPNVEMYNKLVERSAYWASIVTPAEAGDTSDKKVVWKEKQGVVSWATNVDFAVPEIPQKYAHSNAPHIVFVLVDDWGWNDVGYRSTSMAWTTPTIDKLANEGVKLENYFTAYSCIPARGALLTGRYPIRLGLWAAGEGAELPLTEITLAQELKSAGYQTYMVGKWHLGFSTAQHTPSNRGFDWSYTYWNGAIDYWTKQYGFYNDLHFGDDLVTDAEELNSEVHNGYLMQTKAELAIAEHATTYPDKPMFLYYAMQLIHGVWSAPQSYKDRCGMPTTIADPTSQDVTYNYCALNVMLDEAVANLTCALEMHGMADNTVLVLVSDNGGEASVKGNSYPFLGNKGSYFRGGMSGTGFIHSKLLPESVRGQKYEGQMHVTDWLPTLMGLATGNEWSGSLFGAELDGVDQWNAISNAGSTVDNGWLGTAPLVPSPRSEIVHYHDGKVVSSVQIDMWYVTTTLVCLNMLGSWMLTLS